MTKTDSAAIHFLPAEGLQGTLRVPGDKSISHRSLMLTSQVLGDCHIQGLLEGEDVLNTLAAMRQLGVTIEQDGTGWNVRGNGAGSLRAPADVINLGNAGTGVRLLMGLVGAFPFTVFFTGDASLRRRPMERVMAPLRQMGVRFLSSEGDRLPCAVSGGGLMPVTYELPVASAQVKSAILLAGLNTPGATTVIEPQPTRDHTERMLAFLGFRCEVSDQGGGRMITVHGQQQPQRKERTIDIPGDPSSAAFPLVAALMVPGSEVTIENVCINPLRSGLFTTLQEMGAALEIKNIRPSGGEEVADITASYGALKAIDVPAERAPSMIDEYPILAMAAAVAKGTTRLRGLAELRVKESNRLERLAHGLEQCGVTVKIDGDDLIVTGNPEGVPGGVTVDSALDHRIAMAFLILGLRGKKPVKVTGAETIATSFPNFLKLMAHLGARSSTPQRAIASLDHLQETAPLIIAIDGPAASGKGTLARRLAEELGLVYLDTGSLYRAVGMKLVYNNEDPADVAAAVKAAASIQLHDLNNPRLRQERVGQAASVVSAIPKVREVLLAFQRRVAHSPQGAVLDGRDIGTVVCPEATVKLFVTADLETRARRRHRELQGQGITVVYESVVEDLKERDERDSQRATAPLKPADGAIVIDTSAISANEVFTKTMGYIGEITGARGKKTG